MLTNPAAEIHEMGFITKEDLHDFHIKDKVAVSPRLMVERSSVAVKLGAANVELPIKKKSSANPAPLAPK